MSKELDRRDFLLTLAPLGAASAMLLACGEASGQARPIGLATPVPGARIVSGEFVELRAILRTQLPRLQRVDFRANGMLIGSGRWHDPRITWHTDPSGPFTLTAEAIAEQGNIVSTATANVEVLGIMFDRMRTVTLFNNHHQSVDDHGAEPTRSYDVSSVYVDNIQTAATLRRFEGLFTAYDSVSGQNLSLGEFTNNYLRIWHDGNNGFIQSPFAGDVCNVQMGSPDLGAVAPIGITPDGKNVYRAGWDNLNIPLPAAGPNNPLSLSIQFGIVPGSNQRAGVVPFNSVDSTQAIRSSKTGPWLYQHPGIFAVRLTGY